MLPAVLLSGWRQWKLARGHRFNCVSDFKLEGRSTQPADTCGTCPTPGKPAGPDRLRWFVAHLVPRGDRVVTRPQSSADFPLSFFRRQSGRWCMGGLAWWSAKGSERGDVAWSIEQPCCSRVHTSAAAELVELSMISFIVTIGLLLCFATQPVAHSTTALLVTVE